jgi:hypothetical protein
MSFSATASSMPMVRGSASLARFALFWSRLFETASEATLKDALELDPVLGLEEGRFVEESATVVASGEDAVADDQVEVGMGVEGGAEAVQEAYGPELGVRGRTGAGVAERGADGA